MKSERKKETTTTNRNNSAMHIFSLHKSSIVHHESQSRIHIFYVLWMQSTQQIVRRENENEENSLNE